MIPLKEIELGETSYELEDSPNMFEISSPKKITNAEEAESEMQSFSADYWTAAKLKKRGYSINDIYKHFGGKYKATHISYMLEKIIIVNNFMTSRDATILRHQMLDELEALEKQVWDTAGLDENNNTFLDDKQIRTLLSIKDRRINLQGLNAPEKVEIDVNHTIQDAREKLMDSYKRWEELKEKNRQKNMNKMIDITPKIDIK